LVSLATYNIGNVRLLAPIRFGLSNNIGNVGILAPIWFDYNSNIGNVQL